MLLKSKFFLIFILGTTLCLSTVWGGSVKNQIEALKRQIAIKTLKIETLKKEATKLTSKRITGTSEYEQKNHPCNICDEVAKNCQELSAVAEDECFGLCQVDLVDDSCLAVYKSKGCYELYASNPKRLNTQQRNKVNNCWQVRDSKRVEVLKEQIESNQSMIDDMNEQIRLLEHNEESKVDDRRTIKEVSTAKNSARVNRAPALPVTKQIAQ